MRRGDPSQRRPGRNEPCYDVSVAAFTRWGTLRDMLALHEEIGQLVGTDAPGWTPPVDLSETADGFTLTVELPGLRREQVEIQAEARRVVIRGERGGYQVPCEHHHRVERGHGRFSRSFVLPEAVDVDAVSADLRDGLLTVSLPKVGGAEARRVEVTS